MPKTCANCALAASSQPKCLRTSAAIQPNDSCSYWTKTLEYCSNCGALILKPIIENNHYLCADCASLSGTCRRCVNYNICPFETHQSPTPKVIQKQIRQGNSILSTQIRNPDRIEETCASLCNCFSPTFGCLKENNTCGLYRRKELV